MRNSALTMVSSKTIVSPRRGIFGEERGGAEDCEGEVELCCVVTGPTPSLIYREEGRWWSGLTSREGRGGAERNA